jgi:glycosyltransferase involved in cell wall biosynthesis
VSSARFRVRQYIEPLSELGILVREYPAPLGAFPPRNPLLRPAWGLSTLLTRLPGVAMSHTYDITLLQREMVSTLLTLEPLTKGPRIWDVDDAVWLHSRFACVEKIIRRCDAVICGNQFIADWVSGHNSNVSVLPTAVDTDRFRPRHNENRAGQIIIGWMGQSSGYRFLESVREAICHILEKHRDVVFRVVSERPPPSDLLPHRGLEFALWSAESEIRALQSFDIGIMPIDSSTWSRGKCSYKMLLCMSCGVPVVASDFGMNTEVLKHGCIGYGARNPDEWIQALDCLIKNPSLRSEMGRRGRQVVEEFYSMRVLTPRLARMLRCEW